MSYLFTNNKSVYTCASKNLSRYHNSLSTQLRILLPPFNFTQNFKCASYALPHLKPTPSIQDSYCTVNIHYLLYPIHFRTSPFLYFDLLIFLSIHKFRGFIFIFIPLSISVHVPSAFFTFSLRQIFLQIYYTLFYSSIFCPNLQTRNIL